MQAARNAGGIVFACVILAVVFFPIGLVSSTADSPEPQLERQPALRGVRAEVTVKRQGRVLELDYALQDGVGARMPTGNRPPAPRFTVTKNGQQVGSGTFEYG